MTNEITKTKRMLDNIPYHFELRFGVTGIVEAHRDGYPLSYEWVELERDRLSRVLDSMEEKK